MNGHRILMAIVLAVVLTPLAAAHALPINPWSMTHGSAVVSTEGPRTSPAADPQGTDADTFTPARSPFGAAEPIMLLLLGSGLIALASMGRRVERTNARVTEKK